MTPWTRLPGLVGIALLNGSVSALAQAGAARDEFVPVDQLPPQEQLPAGPLLIAAYVFVLVALFVYVFSIARRLTAVQSQVGQLESELKRSGRH